MLGSAKSTAARSIGDFKKIADVAALAERYAKRVKLGQETADFALEIRLRAERGLGEVLARAPKHKGLLKREPTVPEGNHGEPSTLAELGITKNLSSQSQKLAAIPSETFEAKLAAGERRRFAFVRTKETTIKDPLGAFVHALLPLRKNPVANYVASGIQEERDALEVRFPSLKGTRELEWQAGSEIFAALRHAQIPVRGARANGRGSVANVLKLAMVKVSECLPAGSQLQACEPAILTESHCTRHNASPLKSNTVIVHRVPQMLFAAKVTLRTLT